LDNNPTYKQGLIVANFPWIISLGTDFTIQPNFARLKVNFEF